MKKFTALLLVLIMALSMAACGQTAQPAGRPAQQRVPNAGQPQIRQTTTGGAALSTLMRSAARRYTPAPAMRVPGMSAPRE